MDSPPKFFKILLPTHIEEPKLIIPKMFIKNYGKLLSSSVILKLPDGREWKVGLTTADNSDVWLQKGWDKFAQYYCLEFGSLLVFKLLEGRNRSSSFKVYIFDITGVETRYSSNLNDCTQKFDSDDSDESSESFRQHSKKRMKASVFCRRSCKKTRNEDFLSIKTEPEEEQEEKGCNISSCEERSVLKKNIASTRNPFFTVKIQSKSYKQWKTVLNIPKGFANKHFLPEMNKAKLKVKNKEWIVTLKQYVNHARFSAGWSKFHDENELRDEDTCLFEMLCKNNCIFKVTIFNKVI